MADRQEMEPAGWQWRFRAVEKDGMGPWSDWKEGRAPKVLSNAHQVEERPLYTAAQLAEARAQAWEEGREASAAYLDEYASDLPVNTMGHYQTTSRAAEIRARLNPYRSE